MPAAAPANGFHTKVAKAAEEDLLCVFASWREEKGSGNGPPPPTPVDRLSVYFPGGLLCS